MRQAGISPVADDAILLSRGPFTALEAVFGVLNGSIGTMVRRRERSTMEDEARPDFSIIVRDNEQAAAQALADESFVQAYLLVHALIESLLRVFLRISEGKDVSFHNLIRKYQSYLKEQDYPIPTFMNELTQLNRRRNRIVHRLWRKGFSLTNRQTEPAARAAVTMYGLLIEWLETFDPEITHIGFRYDDSV